MTCNPIDVSLHNTILNLIVNRSGNIIVSEESAGFAMSRIADPNDDRLNATPESKRGGRIKKARAASGLSQEQLAVEIGKVRPTIVQYEAGKITPPIEVIEKIAEVLDVSPAYLAFGAIAETDIESRSDHISLPIGIWNNEHIKWEDHIILPAGTVKELEWEKQLLSAIRLDIGSAYLGLGVGDLLIIEADVSEVCADGRIYVFPSSGGIMAMRSEALPNGNDHSVVLSGPNGQSLTPDKAPETIGRVIGQIRSIKRF